MIGSWNGNGNSLVGEHMPFEFYAQAYQRIVAGETLKAVAEDLGRSVEGLRNALKRRNLNPKQSLLHHPPADPVHQRLLDSHKEGLTVRQLSLKFDYSRGHVRWVLKKHGLAANRPKVMRPKILELFNEGKSVTQIHDATGASLRYIENTLRAAGVRKQRKGKVTFYVPCPVETQN